MPKGKKQTVAGIEVRSLQSFFLLAPILVCFHLQFVGYGAHHDRYPHVYLTAAAAIGTTPAECDEFAARFEKAYMTLTRGMRVDI